MADITAFTLSAHSLLLAENGDAATTASPSALPQLFFFALIGAAFYFLIIRPQRKRQRNQQAMVAKLGVGDEIVTIGGFHGEIVGEGDDAFELRIAEGVIVTIARNAVSRSLADPLPVLDEVDFDDEFDDDEFDEDDLDSVHDLDDLDVDEDN